ncbi:MAG: lactonase family protein [Bacteroides sp.]|nr:lactonase family protein [Bacteroides sp.]
MAAAAVIAGTASCGSRSNGDSAGAAGSDKAGRLLMLIGSYSGADEEGISLYAFDETDGSSERLGGLYGISNPSFLAIDPTGKHIYSVGENGAGNSSINTIAFNRDSLSLELISTDPVGGAAPCHLALASGADGATHVITANYLGGSATIYRLGPDGTPAGEPQNIIFSGSGPVADRQEQSHAHFITFTPDSSRLLVTDLGADRIHVFPLTGNYNLVDTGAMTDVLLAPGAGPRHIDWHPTLPVGYLIDEIDGNINVLGSDSLNILQTIQADTAGAQGSGDIHVSPDGRYVYSSHRLEADGIAIFSVDSSTGLLTRAGYRPTGRHPRNFAITPDGRFMLVACRDTDTIEVYGIDPSAGGLEKTGRDIAVNKPVCVKFLP